MYKQRLVTFVTKEEAEEFAQKVDGICIPKHDVIDGEFCEWYEVWYIYYYDPRWQETWKDWVRFIFTIVLVFIFTFTLAYTLVDLCCDV